MPEAGLQISISAAAIEDESSPQSAEVLALHDHLRKLALAAPTAAAGEQNVANFITMILAAPVLVEVAKGFFDYLRTRPTGKISISLPEGHPMHGAGPIVIEGISKPTEGSILKILREILDF